MNRIVLIFILVMGILPLTAQPWQKNLPDNKSTYTYNDYQTAFDTYWAPYNVQNGKYIENGITKKAYGWKQFKRWEWENLSQLNSSTGELNTLSAINIYKNAKQNNQIQSLTNNTNSWTSLGPSSSAGGYAGIGRVNCIAFHPTDNNTYWIGAPAGGLWKTSDNGSSWACLTDSNDVMGVSSIIIPTDYATSNTLYIGTGDRDATDNRSIGVLKSTDGGLTWNTTGLTYTLGQNKMVNKLLIDPTNNNILLAATSNGLYKTTNGGTTWSTQLSSNVFMDIEYKPGTPATIYGSTGSGNIYRSTNSGSTWTSTLSTSGSRVEMAVTAASPAIIYALISNSSGGFLRISKSINSGSSFTTVYSSSSSNLMGWSSDGSDSGGQGWYDIAIAASPTNADNVIVGGVISFRSTNGGSAWSCSNCWTGYSGYNLGNHPVVHADKHNLDYRSNGDLFEVNDGGVYISTNDGATWTDKSNGLANSQMYALSVSQTVNNEIIAGLQDNGTKLLSNNSWSDEGGGDGMDCMIDYTDVNIQYASLYYGDFSRTTNHWSTKTNITPAGAGDGAWVSPIAIDPSNSNTIYIGYADLWKSTDKGDNWTQISTVSTSNKLKYIAVAPSNNQTIYMSDNDNIWKTTNGGTAWTNITGSLPASSYYKPITYITVKDTDPNTVWVTLGGYNSDAVYKTTNAGTSWTNISTGLPSIPAHSIVYDKTITTEEVLYAGTQLGVYIKIGAAAWAEYNLALPKVRIGELAIYYDASPANNKLRAATYGRGLWEANLYSVPTNAEPVSNFEADNTSICTGDTINFTDITTNSPTTWSWTFSPSNITYVNSTSSTSQNPKVKFATAGIYSVSLTTTNSNGSNTKVMNNYIKIGGTPAPFLEEFEANSTTLVDWGVSNSDGSTTWALTPTSGNGTSAQSIFMSNVDYNNTGQRDNLIMPVLNLENLSGATLRFKHAYTRYTGYASDTLLIYASDDCGATYALISSLYEDGTGNFATTADMSSAFTPSTTDDWCGSGYGANCDSIDISSYAGNDNVMIVFQNINAYSNNLYLDDIEVVGAISTSLSANFTTSSSAVCTGVSTTFTNTSQNATSYVWKQDDVVISTSMDLTKSFTTEGVINIKLIASDGTDFDSTSQIITVTSSPDMPATISGPANACTNALTSNYTTVGASDATSYIWSISPTTAGSITGNGLTGTVSWSAAFNSTALINVMGTNGCGDGPQTTDYSVSVSAGPMPANTPTGPIDLCINSGTSNYSCSVIINATSYIWTLSPASAGTISNTDQNAVVSWNSSFAGSASIIVVGDNSCGNGTVSPSLTVVIKDVPATASTPSGATTLCQNNSNTQYSVSSIDFADTYNWILNPSNAGSLSINGNFVTIDWDNNYTGNATLKVNAINTCGNGGVSPELSISVYALPATPIITYDGGVLTSSSSTNYKWYKNNYPISGATQQTYNPTANGSYIVEVGNTYGCKSKSTAFDVIDVGISTAFNDNSFEVFPNPANDYLMVTYSGNDDMILKFRNVLGEDIIITEFNNSIKLDLSTISSGVYFVEMYLKNESDTKLVRKVIITKD